MLVQVLDDGQVLGRGRSDAVEDRDLDQLGLELNVDGVNALGVDAGDGSVVALLVTYLLILVLVLHLGTALNILRLDGPHSWRNDAQSDEVLLGLDVRHVDLNRFTNIGLADFDFLLLELALWQGAPDVVAELDDDAVIVKTLHDAAILFLHAGLLQVVEHVLALQELLVVADLDHLVPDIQAHDPKFSTLTLSEYLEVVEGDLLGHLAYSQAQLATGHDLVPLEVVVLFHPEFAHVLDLGVQLRGVDEELLLLVEEGALYADEGLGLACWTV